MLRSAATRSPICSCCARLPSQENPSSAAPTCNHSSFWLQRFDEEPATLLISSREASPLRPRVPPKTPGLHLLSKEADSQSRAHVVAPSCAKPPTFFPTTRFRDQPSHVAACSRTTNGSIKIPRSTEGRRSLSLSLRLGTAVPAPLGSLVHICGPEERRSRVPTTPLEWKTCADGVRHGGGGSDVGVRVQETHQATSSSVCLVKDDRSGISARHNPAVICLVALICGKVSASVKARPRKRERRGLAAAWQHTRRLLTQRYTLDQLHGVWGVMMRDVSPSYYSQRRSFMARPTQHAGRAAALVFLSLHFFMFSSCLSAPALLARQVSLFFFFFIPLQPSSVFPPPQLHLWD